MRTTAFKNTDTSISRHTITFGQHEQPSRSEKSTIIFNENIFYLKGFFKCSFFNNVTILNITGFTYMVLGRRPRHIKPGLMGFTL